LNLLVVLHALLAERHVTRAGKRLGLAQSATSNALDCLRSLFGDQPVERTGAGMTTTPLAQTLRPLLEDACEQVARWRGAVVSQSQGGSEDSPTPQMTR
jgi:DNA-binding transcriptional LysR family regulator